MSHTQVVPERALAVLVRETALSADRACLALAGPPTPPVLERLAQIMQIRTRFGKKPN